MNDISVKALAKINLGLDVLRRREDGYHEVCMVMQTIHLYDKLDIVKNTSGQITMETNLAFLPVNENNLVYKAAKLLCDEFQIKDGIHVNLQKRIPVAAGMAGGSTDAAAVLYGVNKIFDLGLTTEQLMERGVKIGADVPYCLMRGTGRLAISSFFISIPLTKFSIHVFSLLIMTALCLCGVPLPFPKVSAVQLPL